MKRTYRLELSVSCKICDVNFLSSTKDIIRSKVGCFVNQDTDNTTYWWEFESHEPFTKERTDELEKTIKGCIHACLTETNKLKMAKDSFFEAIGWESVYKQTEFFPPNSKPEDWGVHASIQDLPNGPELHCRIAYLDNSVPLKILRFRSFEAAKPMLESLVEICQKHNQ